MKRFQNLLCVVSAEEGHRATLERAVSLAESSGARLTVATVAPKLPPGLGLREGSAEAQALRRALAAELERDLEAFVAPFASRVALTPVVLEGIPFLAIVRRVLRERHDLLIRRAESPTFTQRIFGSDDMHLLRKCPCPVWLTRADEKPRYRSIVAAVDVSGASPDTEEQGLNQLITALAASLALSDGASLHFVTVRDSAGELSERAWSAHTKATGISLQEPESQTEAALGRVAAHLREAIGPEAYATIAPFRHVRRGWPATVIPQTAVELHADLVVMGTVARTGISGLFIGNTAEAVLEQLRCGVLAIKPEGFVSPVTLEDAG